MKSDVVKLFDSYIVAVRFKIWFRNKAAYKNLDFYENYNRDMINKLDTELPMEVNAVYFNFIKVVVFDYNMGYDVEEEEEEVIRERSVERVSDPIPPVYPVVKPPSLPVYFDILNMIFSAASGFDSITNKVGKRVNFRGPHDDRITRAMWEQQLQMEEIDEEEKSKALSEWLDNQPEEEEVITEQDSDETTGGGLSGYINAGRGKINNVGAFANDVLAAYCNIVNNNHFDKSQTVSHIAESAKNDIKRVGEGDDNKIKFILLGAYELINKTVAGRFVR